MRQVFLWISIQMHTKLLSFNPVQMWKTHLSLWPAAKGEVQSLAPTKHIQIRPVIYSSVVNSLKCTGWKRKNSVPPAAVNWVRQKDKAEAVIQRKIWQLFLHRHSSLIIPISSFIKHIQSSSGLFQTASLHTNQDGNPLSRAQTWLRDHSKSKGRFYN